MIGKKLVSLRKQKGLSQEDVASSLNVSRQTISNWENEQALPTIDKGKELSKLYNVSIDELLDNKLVDKEYKIGSNTEKLAGIIITMFKIALVIAIIFLFMLFITVLVRNHNINKESNYKGFYMNCYIGEQHYYFSYHESGKADYGCIRGKCNQNIFDDISNILFAKSTFENKKERVRIYFVNRNGTCEER